MRGDTSDLNRSLTDAERALLRTERSTARLDGAMKTTHLSTGRLGNQFANLAGHIAGVHPVVGNLAQVLGNFALSAGMTVAILGGVAAIAVAYDKLTESSRKAKEEQDKLIASLERSINLKAMGPGGETVEQVEAAKARAAALKEQIKTLEALIVKDAQDADVIASNLAVQQKLNALYVERQNILNKLAGGESIVKEKVNEAIEANKKKVQELTFGFNELRNAAEKVNDEITKEKKDWWRNYIERTNEAISLTEELRRSINSTLPTQLEAIRSLLMPSLSAPEFSMPNISMPFEGLTDAQKDQLRQLGVLTDKNDKNAQMLHDAIWGSAAALANSVVSALNLGGGGRGSNLGGAIGSTAGFALGMWATAGSPIGGAIGSTIGNIAGSLLGGLFDHKKAVNNNTAAVQQLTQAMLLNAPQGFKVASYRYDATDIKDVGTAVRRYRARGGANPLLPGR